MLNNSVESNFKKIYEINSIKKKVITKVAVYFKSFTFFFFMPIILTLPFQFLPYGTPGFLESQVRESMEIHLRCEYYILFFETI